MSTEKPHQSLTLRIDAPATPERTVQIAAAMAEFAQLASDVRMDDGELTLVVANRKGRATLRAWTPAAGQPLSAIEGLLVTPLAAIEARPKSRALAASLAKHASQLKPLAPAFMRGARILVSANDTFARTMQAIATAERRPGDFVRGAASVVSPVLRVGRVAEGKAPSVRLIVEGRPVDIAVAKEKLGDFWEAARQERALRVSLDAAWIRSPDGSFAMDPSESRAIGVDLKWRPLSGASFLDAAKNLRPLSQEELDDLDSSEA